MVDRTSSLARRTGVAGIAAGVFLSVSVAAEIVHSVERDDKVVNLPLSLVYVILYGLGAVFLTVALFSLRELHDAAGRPLSRVGRVGFRAVLGGSALQVLFAIVAAVEEAVTRESPDAAFLLFGVGFLLLIVGSVLLALGLRRAGLLGSAWAFPLVAGGGGLLAIVAGPDPYHDIGLFIFFSAWVALGLAVAWPRTRLRWSAALGLVIALGAAPAAFASPAVETVHFAGSLTGAGANPCTGAPGTFDVTFEGVSHTNITPIGTFHHTATVTGETVFTPDDPSQPTYSGKFTAWDGQNGAENATITSTATFHDTLFGTDGSTIRDRGVFHVTVLADGTVTAALDSFALVCG
jgi:hypothetical protein